MEEISQEEVILNLGDLKRTKLSKKGRNDAISEIFAISKAEFTERTLPSYAKIATTIFDDVDAISEDDAVDALGRFIRDFPKEEALQHIKDGLRSIFAHSSQSLARDQEQTNVRPTRAAATRAKEVIKRTAKGDNAEKSPDPIPPAVKPTPKLGTRPIPAVIEDVEEAEELEEGEEEVEEYESPTNDLQSDAIDEVEENPDLHDPGKYLMPKKFKLLLSVHSPKDIIDVIRAFYVLPLQHHTHEAQNIFDSMFPLVHALRLLLSSPTVSGVEDKIIESLDRSMGRLEVLDSLHRTGAKGAAVTEAHMTNRNLPLHLRKARAAAEKAQSKVFVPVQNSNKRPPRNGGGRGNVGRGNRGGVGGARQQPRGGGGRQNADPPPDFRA